MNALARVVNTLLRRGMLGNIATSLGTATPSLATVGPYPVNGLLIANDKVYRNVGTRTAPVFVVEPTIGVIEQTVRKSEFTDGGGASGTLVLTDQIPDGAIFLGTKLLVPQAFSGDTTAVVTVGDGSDVDRYNTGTPSVFTAAASGVQAGIPSGSKYHTAAQSVTLTITGGSDFGLVANGELTVALYFLNTK